MRLFSKTHKSSLFKRTRRDKRKYFLLRYIMYRLFRFRFCYISFRKQPTQQSFALQCVLICNLKCSEIDKYECFLITGVY